MADFIEDNAGNLYDPDCGCTECTILRLGVEHREEIQEIRGLERKIGRLLSALIYIRDNGDYDEFINSVLAKEDK